MRRILKCLLGLALVTAAAIPSASAAPMAEIETNQGTIVVELDAEKAPITVANFVQYAKDGFYKGTIFHRVINGFMIQGGGFTKEMKQKPTLATIQSEAKNGLKNLRGTIAMARLPDPHSASAQFFINHNNNARLDYPSPDGWGYAVFGRVVKGMEVVDKIALVPTETRGPHQAVPIEPVLISSVRIITDKK